MLGAPRGPHVYQSLGQLRLTARFERIRISAKISPLFCPPDAHDGPHAGIMNGRGTACAIPLEKRRG
jgi:hypothetical protein